MNIQLERSYPTPVCNSTLLPLLLLSLIRQRHTPHSSNCIKKEYDYIVVGGGAAGSVVASRLSEIKSVSVLLLEAGPEPPLLTEVPAFGSYYLGTDVDWKFKTVPQEYAAHGLKNRQLKWATGKMLGGSASHNGMAYLRGTYKDYDEWEALGAKGWGGNDVFPYFLKLEDNRTPSFLANGYHAVGGPISFEQPQYRSKLRKCVHEAAAKLGYHFVDPNAQSLVGFYDLQKNMRDGQRCNSVKGYLVPAENRTNLDILTNAFVTKLVIRNGKATGVKFYHKDQPRFVRAKREVIVSAGTVNTPKLLMLSGIGPREELQKWNIPVIADLPVGKNFHDHGCSLYFFTIDPRFSLYEKMSLPSSIHQYIKNRTGILTSGPTLIQAHLNGLSPDCLTDNPNYAVMFGELPKRCLKGLGFKDKVYDQFIKPYEDQVIARCKAMHIKPKSRGCVKLSSSNPFDPPLIDPNYLEYPEDVEDIADGLKMCKKFLNTKPFKKLGCRPFETLFPGCEMFAGNDDDYFRCYTRSVTFTSYHAVGTSKMGDPLDPTTVVDPDLRVKGIKGLRVVDASVMPVVPSLNINMPTVMIAEKASDTIKNSLFDCKRKQGISCCRE